MVHDKISPEVMETFRKIKAANEERIKKVAIIETLNEFDRAIGKPDTDAEKFVQSEKIFINKVQRELKNRGI